MWVSSVPWGTGPGGSKAWNSETLTGHHEDGPVRKSKAPPLLVVAPTLLQGSGGNYLGTEPRLAIIPQNTLGGTLNTSVNNRFPFFAGK